MKFFVSTITITTIPLARWQCSARQLRGPRATGKTYCRITLHMVSCICPVFMVLTVFVQATVRRRITSFVVSRPLRHRTSFCPKSHHFGVGGESSSKIPCRLISLLDASHEDDSGALRVSSQTNASRGDGVSQSHDTKFKDLPDNWKSHPLCNPTVYFRSWIVPSEEIQTVLRSSEARMYLGAQFEMIDHLRVRLRVVQQHELGKLILLRPDAPPMNDLPQSIRDVLDRRGIVDGPKIPVTYSFNQFTAVYLLEQLLPRDVHPVPSSFETVGHVAHLNLQPHHIPYQGIIGEVLVETLPNIETVVCKIGEVYGPFRTYDMKVLAGRPDTQVELIESGVTLKFDLAQVYWSSRLSEERQRLLKEEFGLSDQRPNSESVDNNLILADAFCGVGALCVQAAARGMQVWANDWNPHAVNCAKDNALRNGMFNKFTRVSCADAIDFLTDLGIQAHRLPDHVVLNFPLQACEFLGSLRWWPADTSVEPRLHVYTFARADGERSAEDVAIDLVADNLLPMPNGAIRRLTELNGEYDCKTKVHHVRDVAPGKFVFCVSFNATNKLIRCMQGDFD